MRCLTSEQTELGQPSRNQLGGVAQEPGRVLLYAFRLVILLLGMDFKEKRLEKMTTFHQT